MPKTLRDAVDLSPVLDGSSASGLIPEVARQDLQQLIELEVAAFHAAFYIKDWWSLVN